ncbi:MAG: polyprenyl synthetase [Chloroflexi bacterium B3_Chlor]|nr:MAG: polyprenyl synthetase [Chloroflexi bacterium B3_Chlor]
MAFDNLSKYLTAIEAEMKAAMAVSEETLAPYYGMMFYHLGWADESFSPREQKSGKRVRPLLCLLSCQACGGDWQQALPAAAAVELIHNFSLIHDDIEDGSLERRHRPTLWSIWGQAQAINAGDGLFVVGRLALQRLLELGVSPAKAVLAFGTVDDTCLSLTEGQYLDLAFEEQEDVTVEMYMQMISKKTAALIACATHLGALLGTESEEAVQHYGTFGRQLGLAFQIVDDILGIWGEEETTGKGVGEDIVNRKKSLPVVYALQKGDRELREIYSQESISPREVQMVMEKLDSLGAREYVHQMATQHWQLALDTLEKTGIRNPAQDRLRELALFLVERQY